MPLSEIAMLIAGRRSGDGKAKLLKALLAQREELRRRSKELRTMLSYLDRKIAWLQSGAKGPAPAHR